MNTSYQPAIIVVAFNRPSSLERLLLSLGRISQAENVKLIISIDNFEPTNLIVKQIAESFTWKHGEKEVIYQKERLGLRKHILQCGDLSKIYGSVIILEDDLLVSPYFYDYTVKALDFYGNDENIAGISLYNQPYEESSHLPFVPTDDSTDNYFIQFPSSLGQAWTYEQWKKFRSWYDENPDLRSLPVPRKVLRWPETSWKKFFCAFLIIKNRFFVYPRVSLTTNFNDPGTHLKERVNHDGQVQLQIFKIDYHFTNLNDSKCIYDAYFELLPACLNQFTADFMEYSYELDLYGHKNLNHVKSRYLITSRPVKASIRNFKRALKPHEMNLIFNIPGDSFSLSKKEDILDVQDIVRKDINDYKYYYHKKLVGWKALLIEYIDRLKNK